MGLSQFFIKKSIFCIVTFLLILLIGILSLNQLPLRQYPDVEQSQITIDTRYPGSSSATVETKITEIIENQISGIEGIKNISSVSRDGSSKIKIEFKIEKNINEAANDVRDAVSRITGRLPKDSDPPEIYKIDSDADAVMYINLASTNLNQMQLTEYAEQNLLDRLSVVPGVAKINVSGKKRKSMRIWIDPQKLSFYGLTVLDIEKKIMEENIEFPAGRLESQTRDFSVRLQSGLNSVEEFKQLVIKTGGDFSYVTLGDIARVELAPEEPRELFRGNGEEMISFGIVKQTSANLISVSENVIKEFEKIQSELPKNIKIYKSWDTSLFVSEALREVLITLLVAILFVTLVIIFFLKNVTISFIPFITVPISILSTFIFLNLFGYSINLITLLALVLCTGLVVDDSIVMLENIYKKIENGKSRIESAIEGSKEVFFAIVSTSIVLISVFLPIVFLKGDTARLFDELAITIIGAIFFSTITSLTLTPMLCSKFIKIKNISKKESNLKKNYIFILKKFIENKNFVFGIFFTAIIGSLFLYISVPKELSPKEDRGAFFLVMNAPEGSSFNNTVNQMLDLEKILLELYTNNEAKRVLLKVPRSFSGSENFSDGIGIIILNHWSERRNINEIISEVRKKANISDSNVRVFPPRGLGQRRSGSQLQFVIGGDDYNELEKNMDKLLNEIKQNPDFVFFDIDYKKTRPQIKVLIDRKKTSELQISSFDIGRTLEILLAGRKINTFIDNGKEYYVIIQATESNRQLKDDLSSIEVKSVNGEMVRLDSLLKFEESAEAKELNRYNRSRSITLKASIKKDFSLGEAISYIEDISKEQLDSDIKTDFKGQSKEFKNSSKQFYFLFILSFLVVYLVLSAQFESFIYPVIIILTVPLSLSGGLLGLWLFGSSLNIFSQIGIIILLGISAKNGILIVEFANQLRAKGKNVKDALIESCERRFRPIIMTAISTIVGAIPLLIGSGAGSQARLTIGVVIFCGLLISIFLTLFLTPFFYNKISRFANK